MDLKKTLEDQSVEFQNKIEVFQKIKNFGDGWVVGRINESLEYLNTFSKTEEKYMALSSSGSLYKELLVNCLCDDFKSLEKIYQKTSKEFKENKNEK